MKVLVTGAGGYIGSNIFSYLTNKNELEIFGIANKSDKNIFACNLVYFNSLKELLKNNPFDVIIHCAAKANLNTNSKDVDFLENIEMTINLVKLSKIYGVKRFIFLSSYMVYGKEYVIDENNFNSSNPYEWYSKSKFICEEVIKESIENPLILRCPSVIKGEQNSLILDFINSAKKNGVIEVFGNGEVSRNFLVIDDLVEFVYNNLNSTLDFFVPYSVNIKIKDLANKILILKKGAKTTFIKNDLELQKSVEVDDFKLSKNEFQISNFYIF